MLGSKNASRRASHKAMTLILGLLSIVFVVSVGYAQYRDAKRMRYCPTPFECRGGWRCRWRSGCEGERIANLPRNQRRRWK